MDTTTDESHTPTNRKLRLKQLIDKGLEIDKNINQRDITDTLRDIEENIDESNNVIDVTDVDDLTKHTTEVVMDAQLLKMNCELISKVIYQNTDFSEHVYANAIMALVSSEGAYKWNNLATIACSIARTVNTKSSMLGAIEVEMKDRVVKERQQRKKKSLAEEKCPETMESMTRKDKGAEKVNIIHNQLTQLFKENNGQPLPFYQLVIHPENFMSTVQNAFQLSFLARDGIVAIEWDEEKFPLVRMTTAEERKIEKDTAQWICSLDMATCRKMIEKYNITQPMLTIAIDDDDDFDDLE